MAATATADLPVIHLVNPATGVDFYYRGRWLRPGKATIGDVKRGWARFPGDKVWLSLPVGVQKQLDAGRLQVAGQFAAKESVADGSSVETMMPKGNASHEVWVQYALSQGMGREEAISLTRDQIKARFAAPAFDPDAPPADATDGGKFELLD